jgi:hypothetical protein
MVRLPYTTALTTLLSYGLLFAFGQLRDFFRKLIDWFKATNVKVRQRISSLSGRILQIWLVS